jgi:hypothetical protein
MKKTYLPVILASDGREYTNVTWDTLEKAEKALYEFIEDFLKYHDDKIVRAYIL